MVMEEGLPIFCHLMDEKALLGYGPYIEAVLSCAIRVFHEAVHDDESKPLLVYPRKMIEEMNCKGICEENSPQFLNNESEDIISLAVDGPHLWAQISYQFLHEYCHRAMRTGWAKGKDKRFCWLEETLCELSSVYFMKRMAQRWMHMPIELRPGYRISLQKYADDVFEKYEDTDEDMPSFLQRERSSLEQNEYQRYKNGFIMTRLLPLFERDSDLWQTIPFIGRVPLECTKGLCDFLLLWKELLPKENPGALSLPELANLLSE